MQMEPQAHARKNGGPLPSFPFPRAGGFVSELLREKDWSKSPLGPLQNWPPSLRSSLELCLDARVPVAIHWGPDFLFFFNDSYAPFLDGREKEALGSPFFSFWGQLRADVRAHFDAVLSRGDSFLMRDFKRALGRNCSERSATFDVSYSPVRDANGVPVGVFAIAHETTEKVANERSWQAERENLEAAFAERTAELTRSRAFLDSLIENLPNMVFVKDAKELRFVRFNRAGEALLGMSRTELIGKNDFDFFPESQARHFTEKDRTVLAGHSIVDIPEEPIETRFGTRILHTRKIPVMGANGEPEYLLGISDDITEQRSAANERLRLSREEAAVGERESANRRVGLLAEASVALSESLDVHLNLQRLANLIVPTLADWCTISMMERGGSPTRIAAVHCNPAKQPLVDELLKLAPSDGYDGSGTTYVVTTGKAVFSPRISEEQLVKAAQSPRHLELMREMGTQSCIVVPIRGREQIHGSITLTSGESRREYTADDLRTADELGRRAGIAIDNALLYRETQQAVASRDAFLSIASHELKTPLTSLTLQAQMRRRQLDRDNFGAFTPGKLAKMVDSDARQLDRLNRLIDDMLDISRINSGKLTIHPEPVNLLQLVREVAERQYEQFAKAGSSLNVNGDETAVGLWDKFRIEQVVTNLLSNALKYGAGNPVTASVLDCGKEAILEVSDQGIGIAEKDQERIFRQFERAVLPTEVSGLGLGLYIVNQILDLHGGSIRVKSKLGSGSRFIVSLPSA